MKESQTIERILNFLMDHLFSVIFMVVMILICLLATWLIRKFTKKKQNQGNMNLSFIMNILIVVVWLVGIAASLSQFKSLNTLTTAMFSSSGIIAVVVGLAAQESFSNIIAGLLIAIFKPFHIGDRVNIVGENTAGFIEEMNLRHTVIRTYTNVRIIVPNNVMGSAKLENSSFAKGFSYPIELSIAYEDREKRYRAIEIMEEVVMDHPKFYDIRTEEQKAQGGKPVAAICTGFLDSGINLKVLMWTERFEDNAAACSACRLEILDRFEKEGIEIPYNKIKIVN